MLTPSDPSFPAASRHNAARGAAASRLNRASGPCAALSNNSGYFAGSRAARLRSALPGTATVSMTVARASTRAGSSALETAEDQRAVGAAEPKGVRQRGVDAQRPGDVRHVVEIAVRVGRVVVSRGRSDVVADREDR